MIGVCDHAVIVNEARSIEAISNLERHLFAYKRRCSSTKQQKVRGVWEMNIVKVIGAHWKLIY
jgi:hypothetical protein